MKVCNGVAPPSVLVGTDKSSHLQLSNLVDRGNLPEASDREEVHIISFAGSAGKFIRAKVSGPHWDGGDPLPLCPAGTDCMSLGVSEGT